jgi:hypothetical protein
MARRNDSVFCIGVTGHQERAGADWAWVREQISNCLARCHPGQAISSLAAGADQLFAEEALKLGIPILAVIPLDGYEALFVDDAARQSYVDLLSHCSVLELKSTKDPKNAFFDAGHAVVDMSNQIVAVWDGRPAQGHGGTADIVHYAMRSGRSVLHLDPIQRKARLIEQEV